VNKRHQTHTSPRLRYALCDPDGVPFVIAHTPELCFEQYVDMRGGMILDKTTEEAYFKSMLHRKWELRHIETNVTVGSQIVTLKEYRRLQRAEDKKDRNNAKACTQKEKGSTTRSEREGSIGQGWPKARAATRTK
jgi:hypothetical protein